MKAFDSIYSYYLGSVNMLQIQIGMSKSYKNVTSSMLLSRLYLPQKIQCRCKFQQRSFRLYNIEAQTLNIYKRNLKLSVNFKYFYLYIMQKKSMLLKRNDRISNLICVLRF